MKLNLLGIWNFYKNNNQDLHECCGPWFRPTLCILEVLSENDETNPLYSKLGNIYIHIETIDLHRMDIIMRETYQVKGTSMEVRNVDSY